MIPVFSMSNGLSASITVMCVDVFSFKCLPYFWSLCEIFSLSVRNRAVKLRLFLTACTG